MRLTTILIALTVCLASALVPAQVPPPMTDPQQIVSQRKDDLPAFAVDKLFATRAIGDSSWSPDGKQIAFIANISGRENLWLIPSEGGWPTQWTTSGQRQSSPAWSPNGKWIAYTSDKDGNDLWDVFIVSTVNGDVLNLSNTPAVSEENPVWSPDSRYLAWQVKAQTSPTYEIEIFDMLFRRRRALTVNSPPELSNLHPIWSHDGKWIAYTQMRADLKDASVFVADVASGKERNLTPHDGEALYTATAWSPDDKELLITSSARNGFRNVALLEVAGKQINWLTRANSDSTAGTFSPDGKYISWTGNAGGKQGIFLYDVAAKQPAPLGLPPGVNASGGSDTAFSRDSSRLLYSHSGPDAPKDLAVYSLSAKRSQQITYSFVAGVHGQDMVVPRLVNFPTSDGKLTISAWVYVPYNQIKNSQVPAVVFVHDGQATQFMDSFHPEMQFLANQGYFVIVPNYRGSTGFGAQFQDANRVDMGGGDLQDIVAAADWIVRTGYADRKKLIVMGTGYGGYLALMAATKAPVSWAAGVAIAPFVNWVTKVNNEDPRLRQYDLATMGNPEKNRELWQDRSPVSFADRLKIPLLLLAGANDPLHPKEEIQQMADAIRKHGGKAESKIYENEGHRFIRTEDAIDAWTRIAGFLKFYAPAPGCGQAACEVP